MKQIFITGFGRIGRSLFRILFDSDEIEIVGINDIYSFEMMRDLLQRDSIYGEYKYDVKLQENYLVLNSKAIKLHNTPNPKDLTLEGVDLLINCTGIFLNREQNEIFLKNGAKKVLISAPASNDIERFVMDLNHIDYQNQTIISNSSCSINAIAPIVDIVNKAKGVSALSSVMYHSYSAYQKLLDSPHYSKDIRRARSATQNILPLLSSAADEILHFFPNLKGATYAKSVRVPVAATTLYDLTMRVEKCVDIDELRELLVLGSQKVNILDITTKPKVSSDYIASPYGATIDLALTKVIEGDLIQIFAWQDNEYGYAYQLARMAKYIV